MTLTEERSRPHVRANGNTRGQRTLQIAARAQLHARLACNGIQMTGSSELGGFLHWKKHLVWTGGNRTEFANTSAVRVIGLLQVYLSALLENGSVEFPTKATAGGGKPGRTSGYVPVPRASGSWDENANS